MSPMSSQVLKTDIENRFCRFLRLEDDSHLKAFRAHPDKHDLVITDKTMPQMTGFDLAKELVLIRPDLPIILCSGFSEKTEVEKAEALG